MKLAYHLYELHSASPLGALARGNVRQGALLRVRSGGSDGYADVHPWAELGDLPLAGQLDRLARGETTDLTRASLALAALDAGARAAGRSLWDGLTVPDSHCLLPGLGGDGRSALEAGLAEGFTRFKIKMGKDLNAEKRHLRELASFLQGVFLANGESPRLRLDYNETLTLARFTEHFTGLEHLLPFLDFIEDPFPFAAAGWSEMSARLGVCLAVDRAASEESAAGFDGVIVHKPARAGPAAPPNVPMGVPGRRLIVTSYLDHPMGQLGAAWVAARLPVGARHERHGLVSHRVYARTRFSDRLGWSGPRLSLPGGPGFGFEEELAELDWKALT
jgi:O-succinylbenzoate synthase